MRVRNVGFRDAIAELTGGRAPSASQKSRPVPAPRPAPEIKARGIPERDAHALVVESERRLWASSEGRIALAYLRGPAKGLSDATIKAAWIGLTAGVQIPGRDGSGAYGASGTVILWFDGERLSLVKVRQPDGRKPKYAEAFRAADFAGLYPGPQTIQPAKPLVIVEGEFDTLLLGQELAGLASVVSLGIASSRIDHRVWLPLRSACPWYIATDADPAGDTAAERWPRSARRARPPMLRPHPADGPSKASTDRCDLKAFGVDLRRWWSDRLRGVEDPPLFSWEELAAWSWRPAEGDPEPDIIKDEPVADRTPDSAV